MTRLEIAVTLLTGLYDVNDVAILRALDNADRILALELRTRLPPQPKDEAASYQATPPL